MITAEEARAELLRRRAQTDLLAFMAYCWWMPTPLKVGRHTRSICKRLTDAIEDYITTGKTTYIVISVPYRHGKSDIVSRALPAYFVGRCNAAGLEPNVMMSGYGASLIEGFSSKAQDIVRSDAYRQVFPQISIGKSSAAEWSVAGSQSTVYATGLGGSITGKGANLIVVDDYCKNREDAESKPLREKLWNSFKDDLTTRLNAGGGVVVVCATRWHEDDIIGRIKRKMEDDSRYPRYEFLTFPARMEGPDGWNVLFPELYDAEWYATQRATLGPYSAAALLDCEPRTSGTALFRREWLNYIMTDPDPDRLKVHLFVDGAKSKADTADFTTIAAIGRGPDAKYYILDIVHERLNLAEKIQKVIELKNLWHVRVVWWEQVGPMSDVEALKIEMDRRMDHFTVRELRHTTNKDFRIRRLVVPYANGEIWMPTRILRQRTRSDGTVECYDAVQEFVDNEYLPYSGKDSTEHDDIIDCIADICDEEVLREFTPPTGGNAAQTHKAATMSRGSSRFDAR